MSPKILTRTFDCERRVGYIYSNKLQISRNFCARIMAVIITLICVVICGIGVKKEYAIDMVDVVLMCFTNSLKDNPACDPKNYPPYYYSKVFAENMY